MVTSMYGYTHVRTPWLYDCQQFSADIYRRAGPIIVYGLVVVLAGRLVRLTSRYAVNIFFWDQWVFHNADLFQKHSPWQMFRWQFGPHRLGLGPLLSILVEAPFRWNTRVQAYEACAVVALATLCALWLKKRLFGSIAIPDIAIPILYLSATQYESLFTNCNFAHGSLPLLLITLYCLAWTVPKLPLKYGLVLALNFATIYTGFGLFLGVVTPLVIGFDYWRNLRSKPSGLLYLVGGLLVSLASIASFFVGYTLQFAAEAFAARSHSPYLYFAYVSLMYANFWVKGATALAALIGVGVILWLLCSLAVALHGMFRSGNPHWLTSTIAAMLISFSLVFALNTAYGRLSLGLPSAQGSRYSNYLALGLFGAYLNLLTLASGKRQQALLATAVLGLLATLPIRADDRYEMRAYSEIKRNWRSCYLSGGTIPECNRIAGYQIEPEPEEWLQEKLRFLQRNRLNLFADE